MPKPRKILLTLYAAIAVGVLVYVVRIALGLEEFQVMLIWLSPLFALLLFLCLAWPVALLFLAMHWKSRKELRLLLYPILLIAPIALVVFLAFFE